jgi:4-hydroxy-tetrahydrodipicolinate synthase
MHFSGSMVALVTPMHKDGTIDHKALCDLVEWHIAEKTTAIIATGTTGESATLNPEEQLTVIKTIIQQVNGRIPVIAGTGSNATETAIKLTENAKNAGADACLIVTPYYNKPSQNGLYEHYRLIALNTHIPIILYNVPGRTGCDLLPETAERLADVPNIIGIKEATGKIERADDIRTRCGGRFDIYSGDDLTAMELILKGAQGVISVTANVAPRKMQAMCEAAQKGDRDTAEKINNDLALLHRHLFIESNPVPTKWALHLMGKIDTGIRMPLLPLDRQYHQEVKAAMQCAGVNEMNATITD